MSHGFLKPLFFVSSFFVSLRIFQASYPFKNPGYTCTHKSDCDCHRSPVFHSSDNLDTNPWSVPVCSPDDGFCYIFRPDGRCTGKEDGSDLEDGFDHAFCLNQNAGHVCPFKYKCDQDADCDCEQSPSFGAFFDNNSTTTNVMGPICDAGRCVIRRDDEVCIGQTDFMDLDGSDMHCKDNKAELRCPVKWICKQCFVSKNRK